MHFCGLYFSPACLNMYLARTLLSRQTKCPNQDARHLPHMCSLMHPESVLNPSADVGEQIKPQIGKTFRFVPMHMQLFAGSGFVQGPGESDAGCRNEEKQQAAGACTKGRPTQIRLYDNSTTRHISCCITCISSHPQRVTRTGFWQPVNQPYSVSLCRTNLHACYFLASDLAPLLAISF